MPSGNTALGAGAPGSGNPGLAESRERLRARLSAPAREWLDAALAAAGAAATEAEVAGTAPSPPAPASPAGQGRVPPVRTRPPAWELRFASAGRHIGRDPGARARPGPGDASGPVAEPADSFSAADPTDTARVLLLHAARATPGTLARLYHRGTAAERRAVLLALPYLPELGDEAVPLVEDALRANDTRLIAAAVGPYAARHLGPHAWRHAVLKCLFTGVPAAAVAGLADRARGDAELARMLGDYARERTAAGRPVPPDLHHVLSLTETRPPAAEPPAAESSAAEPPAAESSTARPAAPPAANPAAPAADPEPSPTEDPEPSATEDPEPSPTEPAATEEH